MLTLGAVLAHKENRPDAFDVEVAKDRKRRARERRKEREQVLRDCGLVKVKGTLGGTYWE